MKNDKQSVQLKIDAAMSALKNGAPGVALDNLQHIVQSGLADASIYIVLAYAYRDLKLLMEASDALDKALAMEPQNLVALIFKGDLLGAANKPRNASMYYQAAIKCAALTSNLAPNLVREIQRAQVMCDRFKSQFQQMLQQELSALTKASALAAPRFTTSMDLLAGKKQIYYQQPKIYYFPELPQIQFYQTDVFPWLKTLEAAYPEIKQEVLALLEDADALVPYVQDVENRPQVSDNNLKNNKAWSAIHLWKDGRIVLKNARRCPKTLAALEEVPFTRMQGRSPNIMFSVLAPNTRIPPHHGLVNTRLICHLPLIVPSQCGLRVGNETRNVVAGKSWVFDDTMEHEAWNLSSEVRVILLLEIWRPELSPVERRLVQSMFSAIDNYQIDSPSWNDQ